MKKPSRFDVFLVTHPRFANRFVALYNKIPARIRQWIADRREPLEGISIEPVRPTLKPVEYKPVVLPKVGNSPKEPTWYAEAKQKGGAKRIARAESKRRRKAASHSRTHPNG